MKNIVRVKDIDPQILNGPYSLRLARAVTAQYLNNGAMYTGIHTATCDLHDFFLTSIIDETSPDVRDEKQKLMVQGGTQYGCSAHQCPFCVYSNLRFYKNLKQEEIIDLFRLALFIHSKENLHSVDERELNLKFTDNGEPFHSPILPDCLDQLLQLFGKDGKILRIKISTVLTNTDLTRETFRRVLDWQEQNQHCASIHLQISYIPYGKNLIPAHEVGEMIIAWKNANPNDKICIAPGLVRGYDYVTFITFCETLKSVAQYCFFRLSVIKPTTDKQKEQMLSRSEMEIINLIIRAKGFKVEPLPQNSSYTRQLEGAGTLSHLPNGKFYDPASYRVWKYTSKSIDPNTPI